MVWDRDSGARSVCKVGVRHSADFLAPPWGRGLRALSNSSWLRSGKPGSNKQQQSWPLRWPASTYQEADVIKAIQQQLALILLQAD